MCHSRLKVTSLIVISVLLKLKFCLLTKHGVMLDNKLHFTDTKGVRYYFIYVLCTYNFLLYII